MNSCLKSVCVPLCGGTHSFKCADIGAGIATGFMDMFSNAVGGLINSNLDYHNWKRKFNAMAEYNKPSAQVQRLLDAGINPFVQDNAQGFAGVDTNVNSTASPAPVSGNGFSNAVNLMSQAQLANAKTPLQKALADAEIFKNNSIANREQADAAIKQLERIIRGTKYGGDYLENSLKKAQIENWQSEADLNNVKKEVQNILHALYNKDLGLKDTELKIAQKNLQRYDEILSARITALRAQAASGFATAENQRAQATTEDELREHKKERLESLAGIARQDWDYYKSIAADRVEMFSKQLEAVGLDNEKIEFEIDKLQRENRFIEARELANIWQQALGGVANIRSANALRARASTYARDIKNKYFGTQVQQKTVNAGSSRTSTYHEFIE